MVELMRTGDTQVRETLTEFLGGATAHNTCMNFPKLKLYYA
jgi:hypothetical protein